MYVHHKATFDEGNLPVTAGSSVQPLTTFLFAVSMYLVCFSVSCILHHLFNRCKNQPKNKNYDVNLDI